MIRSLLAACLASLLAMPGTASAAGNFCPPLPRAEGAVTTVSTAEELWRAVVADKTPNRTVLLEDGTYDLGGLAAREQSFWLDTPGLSIRSASGNRDAVILDLDYGQRALTVAASNITIADLTIARSRTIGVHVVSTDAGSTTGTKIYNVRIVDPGEHAFKANPHAKRIHFTDNGLVACSELKLTAQGREQVLKLNGSCYTGGLNLHLSRGWHVRDNVIKGFWCRTGLSEHAAVFKTGSRDTLVERNRIINNARGIGFGHYQSADTHTTGVRTYADAPCPEAEGSYVEHYGGIIRNNFITADDPALFASEYRFDGGIYLWHACRASVVHNTVFSTDEPFSAIEWRWPNTSGQVINNLTSHRLRARDGARVRQTGNRRSASAQLFLDPGIGDLHLSGTARYAIDKGGKLPHGIAPQDIDGDARPQGRLPDVGADEHTDRSQKRPETAKPQVTKPQQATAAPAAMKPARRLQPVDFRYVGAFRLAGNGERPKTFAWGGGAMTFRPDGDRSGPQDGFPGSLFIMGHARMAYGELPDGNQVAEIDIPTPKPSRDVDSLPRARFLQTFHDVAAGQFKQFEELPRAAMQYLDTPKTGARIHLGFGQHLQPDGPRPTHGWLSPDLKKPDFAGEWFIGDQPQYAVNGYMFEIPKLWADRHVGGRRLATGRFRDGGWSGMGPSLIAYRPWDPKTGTAPPPGTKLNTKVLLLYESSHSTGRIERAMNGYQHPDEWEGGAWITTSTGKSAVLFAGTKGIGRRYWYGFPNPVGPGKPCVQTEAARNFTACRRADGSPCPAQDMTECSGHNDMRGWWASRFAAQFILYDPADLAKVAAGNLKPWQPQPYASLTIDRHMFLNPAGIEPALLGQGVQRRYRIGPVAYDRKNGLLYVLEMFAEEATPVAHVWRVQ